MLYPDAPPNAIELFKECHLSKKKGLAEPVQKAIVSNCFLLNFVHWCE